MRVLLEHLRDRLRAIDAGFFAATAGRSNAEILADLFPRHDAAALTRLANAKEALYRALAAERLTLIAGAVLASPNAQDGGPVALIVAPGPPLGGQARTAANTPCGKAPVYANFIESAATFPNAGPLTMTQGSPSGQAVNDQFAWLTAKEVFDRINQRSDFATQINGLMNEMTNCLGSGLPTPDLPQTAGLNLFGLVPNASTTGTPSYCPAPGYSVNPDQIHLWRNWREQFRYMKCGSGTQCATVNGSSCKGVLLFGGQRTGTQTRACLLYTSPSPRD